MGNLESKVVIITGAAQGMGLAHAHRCVAEGARVVATDIRGDVGRDATAALGHGATFIAHDVSDADSWTSVIAAALDRFGRLDGLVNNAAIYPTPSRIEHEEPEALERVLRVNVVGSWHGIRAVIEPMRAVGGGSIVNISSLAGMRGFVNLGSYSASKWAVRGITKVAARELGPDNIRVNSIHPGGIAETGMYSPPADETAYERHYRGHPLGRPGQPDEVSGVVTYLLSDLSSYVTGYEHMVDGGSNV